MSNENIMEEVMYKAHHEGIVSQVSSKAKELRETKSVDLYDSYIQAYDIIKSESQDNLDRK